MTDDGYTIDYVPGEEWPTPDPFFLNGQEYPPPRLPLECLGALGPIVEGFAANVSTAPDYVLQAHLAIAAGVIGAARAIEIRPNFVQPAALYCLIVGRPSTHKSVALTPLINAVKTLEREEEKSVKAPITGIYPRLVIVDVTTEKLSSLFEHNYRGLLLARDELSGLLGNLNKYGGEGDAATYLSAYDGEATPLDRVKAGAIRPQRALLSIVGGIQPDRFREFLMERTDDGFLARFLLAWPEPPPLVFDTPPYRMEYLMPFLRKLRLLQMDARPDGPPAPRLLPLASNAKAFYGAWFVAQGVRARQENGPMAQFLGKSYGGVGRLALILELIEWALSERGPSEGPAEVALPAVQNAIALYSDYFEPMAKRVYMEASLSQTDRLAVMVVAKLSKEKVLKFNATQLRRSGGIPGLNGSSAAPMRAVLEKLIEAGWVRPLPRHGNKPGRSANEFLVNPAILST